MAANAKRTHLFPSNKQQRQLHKGVETYLYFWLHFSGVLLVVDGRDRQLLVQYNPVLAHLAHAVEHAMGPSWNINGDLRPAQLREGLGIQHQEERTFVLDTRKVCPLKLKSCDFQTVKIKRKSFALLRLSTSLLLFFFPTARCQNTMPASVIFVCAWKPCGWLTSLGVMMTDRTTPSSSSVAPGEATKTGSDGYRPG